jgi:hypothetical protein
MEMSAAPRRATYDHLVAVPDNLVAEIVDGELCTSPRPATSHARAGSPIGTSLRAEPFEAIALDMSRWWMPA